MTPDTSLQVFPLRVRTRFDGFCLFDDMTAALEQNRMALQTGDIIAISSKYVASSQARLVDPRSVRVHDAGTRLSRLYGLDPGFAEIIARESDNIIGGMPGFVLCTIDGMLAPNAGADKSNSVDGHIILYPQEPYLDALNLQRRIFLKHMMHVGIILTDSRLAPARAGTVGVAIACAGFEPILDKRAHLDLTGNPLRVTMQASADALATVANHAMGEAAESSPYVIIRGSGAVMTTRRIFSSEVAVPHDQCVYMRSMKK